MGNSNQAGGTSSPAYEQLGVQQNEMLSHLIMLRDKNTQQRCMLKQINLSSEEECSRMVRDMSHRRNMSQRRMGKYIIKVERVEWKEVTEICGKNYKVMVFLEPIDSSLSQEYEERRKKRQPFTEEEIMTVLKAVTGNLTAMYDNSFKNIHLYKESILKCGEQYKVVDSQLSNRVHPYFEILNMVPCKPGTYLAPQLMEQLRKDNPDFYPSPKADIFTLAVVALELATFHEFDSLYDYQLKTINTKGLHQIVRNISYSHQLKDILMSMLQEDEEERIGLISLKQMLRGDNENMSLVSMRSESQAPKLSTRGFISLNKPVSSGNRLGKYSYQDHQFEPSQTVSYERPASRHQSEYKPVLPQRETEPIRIEHESINRIKLTKPEYTPIEKWSEQTEKMVKKPITALHNQPVSNFEVKETPKAAGNPHHHQFQTPVNMMYESIQSQHNAPKDTPIQEIQTLVSNYKQPGGSEFFKLRAYGAHEFNNGARYEGEMNSRNEFDGNGMLYYPSGALCYSGSWKANSFYGFGVLHNEEPNREHADYRNLNCWQRNTWLSYEGQFIDDKKEGFGTVLFPNGDKFSGCFKGDCIEGFGSYYSAVTKEHINGIWSQNVLQR